MKHRFSFIAALIASVMFIAIGCSNAITVTDTSKNGNYTENGMALVTVTLGDMPSYRAIYPNEITSEKKSSLVYKLYGETKVLSTIKGDKLSSGIELQYSDLIGEGALVELDPILWDSLTLKAFEQGELKNAILEGKILNKDLKTGGEPIVFNLLPEIGGLTKGTVDVSVNFYNEGTDVANSVKLDIVELGDGKTTVLKEGNAPIVFNTNDYTTHSADYFGVHMGTDKITQGVPSGKYYFKATFYDQADGAGNIICQYLTHIQIDGGNTSSAVIEIPKGSFNTKPKAPTGLSAKTSFVPDEVKGTKIVINESAQKYAQEDADTDSENRYNVVLTWNDNSYNETGFILTATANRETFTVSNNGAVAKIEGASVTSGAELVENTGNMGADCKSVTISLPVGKYITAMSVKATNGFGESTADDMTIPNGNLGMFTVTYDMDTATLSKTATANGKIQLGTGTSSLRYVSVAYDYGSTENLVEKASVSCEKYSFEKWQYNSNDVTTLGDLAGAANTNVTVKPVWMSPITIKVTYPSYTEYKDLPLLDGVVPSEKNTIIPKEQDGSNKITLTLPTVVDTAKITNVSFKIYDPKPSADATPLWESNGGDEANALQNTVVTSKVADGSGASIEWDINKFKTLDRATYPFAVYRLEISYDYSPKTGAQAVTKDGIFFVDIR